VKLDILVAWFLPIRADGLLIYWFLAAALVPVAFVLAVSGKTVAPKTKHTVQIHSSSRAALLWTIALFFLYVGSEINMGAWLYTYAIQAAQFSPTTAAYLVAAFWGAFMVGRLLSIFGSTHLNPSQYVCGGLLAGSLSTVGVIIFSSYAGPYLWICVAGLGLSMAAVFPQAFSYVSDILGISGRRTATLLIAGSFGGMLLPWSTGQLLESISPHALPMIVGLAMLLALGAFVMVGRTARNVCESIPRS
jgi:fucose permease